MTTQTRTGAFAPGLIPFPKDKIVDINKDGKPVTTSLLVADRFEKNHRDILRIIGNLECSDEFNQRNFALISYTDQLNRSQPMYLITRDGFTILAMGFTGKKAMEWKEKYINAFNWMEQTIHDRGMMISTYNSEIPNGENESLATIRYKDYKAVVNYDAVFLLKEALGGVGIGRDMGAFNAVVKCLAELGTALAKRKASQNISLIDDNGNGLGEISRRTLERWRKELIDLKLSFYIHNSRTMDWKKYNKMVRYREMGLTQRETAKLLDISRDTVQQCERIAKQYELKLVQGGAA